MCIRDSAMPEGCAVKNVSMKNGVVTINLTKEFAPEDGQDQVQMLRAIVYTASQFPGVKEVKLQVEGAPYELPEEMCIRDRCGSLAMRCQFYPYGKTARGARMRTAPSAIPLSAIAPTMRSRWLHRLAMSALPAPSPA